MKDLRKEIEKILRSYFVDADKDDDWGTLKRTDQLLALFNSNLKEQREKIIKEIKSYEYEGDFDGDRFCFQQVTAY